MKILELEKKSSLTNISDLQGNYYYFNGDLKDIVLGLKANLPIVKNNTVEEFYDILAQIGWREKALIHFISVNTQYNRIRWGLEGLSKSHTGSREEYVNLLPFHSLIFPICADILTARKYV